MRVTNLTTKERRLRDILAHQERLEAARDRVSTGRRVGRPSDAPTEIEELLRTQSRLSELEQRRDSLDSALAFMRAGESALGEVTPALRQIRNLAIQANNGTISPDQRPILADQVSRLRDQVMDHLNQRLGGRYLFAGTNTSTRPFVPGPPVTYAGNGTPLHLVLEGGASFATSETGDQLMNARNGTNLFANLQSLEAAIRAGDPNGIATALTALDEDMNNVVRVHADLGARVQYLDLVRDVTEDEVVAAKDRQSQLQDVDLAAAVLDVRTAETAHEASLLTASRLDQPSLVDYLR